MEEQKREYLEAHGWKVGGARDFLSLTEEEVGFIEIKIALSENEIFLAQEEMEISDDLAALREDAPAATMTTGKVSEDARKYQAFVRAYMAMDPKKRQDAMTAAIAALTDAKKADVFAYALAIKEGVINRTSA